MVDVRYGAIVVLVLGAGCLNAPVYRTAKTLPPGTWDVGLGIKAVRYTFVEEDSSGDKRIASVVLPDVVPEVMAHHGVAEGFELGGRIAASQMMFELDAKLRLTPPDSQLTVALQAALGYQGLIVLEGFHGTLPLLFTYDVGPELAINFSPFVQVQRYSVTSWAAEEDTQLAAFAQRSVMAGAGIGFEFPLGLGTIAPSLTYSRVAYRLDDMAAPPDMSTVTRLATDYFVLFVAISRNTSKQN